MSSRPPLRLLTRPKLPTLRQLAMTDPEVALFLQFIAQNDLRKEAIQALNHEIQWQRQIRKDENARIVGLRLVTSPSQE